MFAGVHEQGQLPGWVKLPASVAIPFGAFEAALQDETNADVSVDFVKLAGFGGAPQEDMSNLDAVRNAVRRLRAPQGFREALQDAFTEEGVLKFEIGAICNRMLSFIFCSLYIHFRVLGLGLGV